MGRKLFIINIPGRSAPLLEDLPSVGGVGLRGITQCWLSSLDSRQIGGSSPAPIHPFSGLQ
jgi:hypothetical protein